GPGLAGDDRSGVAHAAARRRGRSRDEGYYRLRHRLDVVGRFLLGGAADLADHYHCGRVRVSLEQRERLTLRGADDRVAADADARGLPDAEAGQLVDRLVDERP